MIWRPGWLLSSPWYLTVATLKFMGPGELQLASPPPLPSCHPSRQKTYKYHLNGFVCWFGLFLGFRVLQFPLSLRTPPTEARPRVTEGEAGAELPTSVAIFSQAIASVPTATLWPLASSPQPLCGYQPFRHVRRCAGWRVEVDLQPLHEDRRPRSGLAVGGTQTLVSRCLLHRKGSLQLRCLLSGCLVAGVAELQGKIS